MDIDVLNILFTLWHVMSSTHSRYLPFEPSNPCSSTLHNVWDNVGAVDDETDDNNEDENDLFDVDTSMDIEVAEGDTGAIKAAPVTSFRPGDVVGKIMAFIAQLQSSSEDTHEYLKKKISISRGCNALEIKIWVRGRWKSLSDCFRVILSQQKVCQAHCA
jgi:hypothetical protein